MIDYYKGAYGFNLIFRLHGSAVYKSVIPALVSVLVFWFYQSQYWTHISGNYDLVREPDVVEVLVASVSFLIIFRASFSYQRYWSACGDVHVFMSKLLDATVHTAAFHMQCDHYATIKPKSFFDYPELIGNNDLARYKEGYSRSKHNNDEESISMRKVRLSENTQDTKYLRKRKSLRPAPAQYGTRTIREIPTSSVHEPVSVDAHSETYMRETKTREVKTESQFRYSSPGRLESNWNSKTATTSLPQINNFINKEKSKSIGHTQTLFLQELAHLSSLLVAVAFCTLRNNEDGAPSPLDTYIPGSNWPAVDPLVMSKEEKRKTTVKSSRCHSLCFWLGIKRTKYKAPRPMLVLGGVSENEIIQLQKARGASAKTTLVFYWLSEFIGREHLAGSTGAIAPTIISRVFQFLSEGMVYYNQARKTMFIPFPFPHAQISSLFIVVMVMIVPLLMNQYANERWLGSILTFLTVTCLSGLHEVGRELENPFRNTPNDIPLSTLLAMYNESLVVMCSGYHPDAYLNQEFSLHLSNDAEKNSDSASPKFNQQYARLRDTFHRQAVEIQELRSLVGFVLQADKVTDILS